MKISRNILPCTVGLAAAVAVVAAGIYYHSTRLPHPATADRDGLLRWIVLRDLSQEVPPTQRISAQRFEQEFGGGGDLAKAKQRLSLERQERVWNNVVLLLQAWFEQKVERYSELSEGDRTAYVDATLATIRAWKGLGSLQSSGQGENAGKTVNPLTTLLDRLPQWKDQWEPQRREQTDRFIAALKLRWLQQTVLGLASPAGADPARSSTH